MMEIRYKNCLEICGEQDGELENSVLGGPMFSGEIIVETWNYCGNIV